MAKGPNEIRDEKARKGIGYTPKGIPALNKGKTRSSDMAPKKFSNPKGGEMYKKPAELSSKGSHKDQSSGQSMPIKKGDDNKKRYAGVEQPLQYSNGVPGLQRTRFVN